MSDLKVAIGEKFRSIIHLCPPLYSFCLKIVTDRGRSYYEKIDEQKHYRDMIRTLKDSKNGESCFIIGNGPSLKAEDLEKLKEYGIDSFASNRIYKIFDQTSWRPTYFSVVDWKGIPDEDADSMNDVPYLFFSDYFWRKHHVTNPNSIVFRGIRLTNARLESYKFSEDASQQIYMKGSVTYTNFQLAAYMGYKRIYLLGMDNSYAYVMGSDGKTTKQKGVDNSHFYKDENPTHIYSEKEAMDNCFIAAKEYAETHDIEIINATRGGMLELFERVGFDELMETENNLYRRLKK